MHFPISQLYPVLLVFWGILFWSRSKVFRIALLISLCVHGVFLIRVSGRQTGGKEPERIVAFTFFQGAGESEPRSANRTGISTPAPPPVPEAAPREDSKTDTESPPQLEQNVPEPAPPRVEEGLPRIEDSSLIDFSAHPEAEDYRRELQRLIRVYQKTPPEILQQGLEARVKVWFNLSRDGKLNQPIFVDLQIRSSNDVVNRVAVDSIVAAADHFPPFPERVNRAELWFYVYVDFANVTFSEE